MFGEHIMKNQQRIGDTSNTKKDKFLALCYIV